MALTAGLESTTSTIFSGAGSEVAGLLAAGGVTGETSGMRLGRSQFRPVKLPKLARQRL